MKKVGVLTFHRAHNYGAVLQCYALQEVLRNMECGVEIIDFTPKSIVDNYKPQVKFNGFNPINWMNAIIRYVTEKEECVIRYNAFNSFIEKNLQLSKYYGSNFPSPLDDYDVIYIGSDQVWRENITKDASKYYWGEIKTLRNTRIVSYAASMEKTFLSEQDSRICRSNLNNFDRISVRESLLLPILQPFTNKNISVTLDPTLLLDKQDYMKIMSEKVVKEEYILVYELGCNPSVDKFALRIANESGLKVVKIFIPLVGNKLSSSNSRSFNCISPSPSEFLRLFNDAKYIVTNSFHGTAFSLIFNKQFYSIETGGRTTRIESLLTLLGIVDNAYLKEIESVNVTCDNVDYTKVNDKIKECRTESINYIRSCSYQL